MSSSALGFLRASGWSSHRLVDVRWPRSILRAQTHRRRQQRRRNILFPRPISRHHRSHDRFGEGLVQSQRLSLLASTRGSPFAQATRRSERFLRYAIEVLRFSRFSEQPLERRAI
jgi:hypothetical protein